MAKRYSDNVASQVAAATDIVQVIGEKVRLVRKGDRYWALCPFHEEKTPSFSVHPEKQFYYCFGCRESGDAFTFVMKTQHVQFPEALKMLAERAGIDLPSRSESARVAADARERAVKLNDLAAAFYRSRLEHAEAGRLARDYLTGRHISEDTAKAFCLGLSLPAWDGLLKHTSEKGLHPAQLEEAGLVVRNRDGSGYHDRFRNRLMFPIRDLHGTVIAFGARALADETPKYLNSPETPLFSKSRSFYGLHRAIDSLKRHRRALVMEGYTDVIMAHQFGIDWALATLGTALTVGHVRMLRRHVDGAVLLFDSDEAGRKAAERSAALFLKEDFPVRVCVLPGELDPCDFLCEHGPEEFLKHVEKAEDMLDFRVRQAMEQNDMSTLPGRMSAFDSMAELLADVTEELRRQELLRLVCEKMGLDQRAAAARLARRPSRRGQGDQEATSDSARETSHQQAESNLIGLLLAHNELIPDTSEVFPDAFRCPTRKSIANRIAELYQLQGQVATQDLTEFWVKPEESRILAEAIQRESKLTAPPEKRLGDYLAYWRYEKLETNLQKTKMRMAATPPRTEEEEAHLLALFHNRQSAKHKATLKYRGGKRNQAALIRPEEDDE